MGVAGFDPISEVLIAAYGLSLLPTTLHLLSIRLYCRCDNNPPHLGRDCCVFFNFSVSKAVPLKGPS